MQKGEKKTTKQVPTEKLEVQVIHLAFLLASELPFLRLFLFPCSWCMYILAGSIAGGP